MGDPAYAETSTAYIRFTGRSVARELRGSPSWTKRRRLRQMGMPIWFQSGSMRPIHLSWVN